MVVQSDELERQCYIDAITRLLGKADLEALELIWIAARNLTKTPSLEDVGVQTLTKLDIAKHQHGDKR